MQEDRLGFLFRAVQRNQPLRAGGRGHPPLPAHGVDGAGALSPAADPAPGLPRPPPPVRSARLHPDREGVLLDRGLPRPPASRHVHCGRVTGGSAGRRPGCTSPRASSSRSARPTRTSGRSGSRRPGTSPPTCSSTSCDYNNLDEIADQKYKEISSDSLRVPPHHLDLQELARSARSSCRASLWRSTISATRPSSCGAPQCSRTASAPRSREVPEPLRREPGHEGGATRRALRRHRRGLRLDVRAGSRSSTGRSATSSTSRRRWGSSSRKWSGSGWGRTSSPRSPAWRFHATSSAGLRASGREDGFVRLVPGSGHAERGPGRGRLPHPLRPRAAELRVNVSLDDNGALLAAPDGRRQPRNAVLRDGLRGRPDPSASARISPWPRGSTPSTKEAACAACRSRITTWTAKDVVVTFDGLMSDPRFVKQMQAILRVLEEKIGRPGRYRVRARRRTSLPPAVPHPERLGVFRAGSHPRRRSLRIA